MGALKGRFGSLRGLRQQLHSRKAQILAIEWVRTCIVLHNLILEVERNQEDMWEWERRGDNVDAQEVEGFRWDGAVHASDEVDDAEEKRYQVKYALFAELYEREIN
jgi:hypothetical protein